MEIVIILAGFTADYLTKNWAYSILREGRVIDIIKGYFNFEYVENTGAAFGSFSGSPIILGVVSIIMVGILIYALINGRKTESGKQRGIIYKIAVSLMISGALGNIFDRFTKGFVVDFIHLHIEGRYHFPVFNIADILVVSGVILLSIYLIFLDEDSGHGKSK